MAAWTRMSCGENNISVINTWAVWVLSFLFLSAALGHVRLSGRVGRP
jgi:hypothetical protein